MRRATATGCSRCSTSSSGRRSSGESVGTIDVIGFAAEGDRAVVQIFPLRGGKMVDRHSFHLENVGGQDLTTVIESFALEYYGSAPSVPPQIIVPHDSGDLSALAEFLSEKRGAARRGARRRARREAAAAAARRRERAARARLGAGRDRAEARAARRGARGAARGAQPRVAAAADRVLRHLARDGPGSRRLDGRLPGRACRGSPTTASSASRPPATIPTTSRRWPR